MAQLANAESTPERSSQLVPLQGKWGWIMALGVVYLIAGVLALGSVVTATAVTVFFVGIMMIVAGVGELIGAFQIKSWGKFFLLGLVGVLYIIAGFVTLQNPVLAAVMLTFVLGFALIASGLTKVFLAFSVKQEQSWVWVALSGIVTLVLGVMILLRWPVSSVYILGIFLGVDLIVAGVGWISLGLGLKRSKS